MLSAKLFIFVVAMLHLDLVTAAVDRQYPAEKPAELAHIPGCYFISENKVLPYGASYPEGECLKYSCASNGAISIISCGAVGAGPGCRIVSDPSLPYPDCCPTVECGDQNSTVNATTDW